MTSSRATLILWVKSWGDSEGEMLVSRAHEANTLDLLERSKDVTDIGQVIVITNSSRLTRVLRDLPVILEADPHPAPFSFGKKLRSIIEKHAIGTLVYLGSGSGVYMDVEDLARLTRAALVFPRTLWVNNFYSTDFAAFNTRSIRSRLSQCERDNQLGWRLGRKTGIKACVLPPSLMTRFDIDTPVDLMVLKTNGRAPGLHLAEFLSGVALDLSSLFAVMDLLVRREARILVIGRVPLEIAAFFDKATACHVDFHIEGRGMEAREESRGDPPCSLVGKSLEKMGFSEFFQALSRDAWAVIMDSRVCFRHFDLIPSRRDRFFSDLLRPDQVRDPLVQLFTQYAVKSSIPFILGGHTLVSGSLFALAESAWRGAEKPLCRDIEDISEAHWYGEHFGMTQEAS